MVSSVLREMDANEDMGNCNGRQHCELAQCSKNGQVNNGVVISGAVGAEEGSSDGSKSVRTFKRRKQVKGSSNDKSLEDRRRPFQESASHLADQTINEPLTTFIDDNSCAHSNLPKTDCHTIMNGSDPQRRWRNDLLNCIYQSLGANKGGIEDCIQDALAYQQEIHSRPIQKCIHTDECKEKCSSQTCQMQNGSATMDEGHMDVTSNGPTGGQNQHSVTELCQRAFYDIIISKKFTLLCQLLFENFKGCEVHNLFDLNLINLRMREGAYEELPLQFSSDLQQIWKKLQNIGSELTSLAKDLSDVSRTSCHAQFHTTELYPEAKVERSEGCGLHGVCSCKCCEQKADGRDCLVCDSCKEMYHVSCIWPAVKEIPPSWYCARCITSGIGSTHDNCAICDRLNAPRTNEETPEENSNCCMEEEKLHPSDGSRNELLCKICGNNVEKSENFCRCGHPYCPNEYYHVRCLTVKQLKLHGPRWYCPSCLCRACLTDKDDDEIILCDGCDQGYHMYCAEPRLTRIPEGKWFCRKCDKGMKKITRAKRAYEEYEKKREKITEEGKRIFESFGKLQDGRGEKEGRDKGQAGMDMLLSAAKKLNYEENIAVGNM